MESSRRWSGYVCPDCRFVFRVPRDHDGHGIVCPSCRRMLRIPTQGDVTPPLQVSLRRMVSESPPAGTENPGVVKRKRRRKSGDADNLSWEQENLRRVGRRGDRRQMRLMLIGGGVMLASILTVAMVAMHSSQPVEPVAKKPSQPVATTEVKPERDEKVLGAQVEPLVRKFLTASSVSEMLSLVRHPDVSGPRMQVFYPNGAVTSDGVSSIGDGVASLQEKGVWTASVTTAGHESKTIQLVETPAGLKVDWESWVGWSDMPWDELMAKRPAEGHLFRALVKPSDYYNFAFSDEKKWQAYSIVSPDGEHAIYGYAEKGSLVERRLLPDPDHTEVQVILVLKYPPNATNSNQVEVVEVKSNSWVEPDSPPP